MSLLAASKISGNPAVQARLESAIRITATERIAWAGNPGLLAARALNDMPTVLKQFSTLLATNPAITNAACPECGCAWQTTDGKPIDESIQWLVTNKWSTVADRLYPTSPPAESA